MTVGIYQITNTANGKKYIGQSIDVERRLKQHKWELNNNSHSNYHLQGSWNKYGSDSFTFDIIKECSESLLDYYEKEYIFTWNLTNDVNGYNLQDGGGHFKHSIETKQKISESKQKMSDETKKKISENNGRYWKGKARSEETKKKISEANKGKTLSEEAKKKMSEARKGEKHSMFGKHHSKNTKIEISKARNTTGFYSVSIQPHPSAKQGFCFRYNYTKNKKRKAIYSVSIFKLEQKVRDAGLEWIVLDDEMAAQTIALSPN